MVSTTKTPAETGQALLARVNRAKQELREAEEDLKTFRADCSHDGDTETFPTIDGPGVGIGVICNICGEQIR